MSDSIPLPALYIPHGAGPCFFMDWPGDPHMWDKMADFLRNLLAPLPQRPTAILVISAHWIEDEFTVMTAAHPGMLFDYSGFPESTYALEYPAPGSPQLAAQVADLLEQNGLAVQRDAQRGFDHGAFVPLLLINPAADIPVVQLSLKNGMDAQTHLRAGRALQSLREQGVLIIGSGMSFHNMRGFKESFTQLSQEFDDWLADAVSKASTQRAEQLIAWQQAPHARQIHPYPDHLLPLMVVAGAAGDDSGRRIFADQVLHVIVSAHEFA